MAAANETATGGEAPKKRRKPQGPRVNKPIFAVVRYTDEQGQEVRLDKARLEISLERDAGNLIELMENGGCVKRVTLPTASKPAAAPAASGS